MGKKNGKRTKSLEDRFHAAKSKPSKRIEFDDDEVTDVIDLALAEVHETSRKSLEKVKKVAQNLRGISVRPIESEG